jgi:hypothetical protein
MIRVVDSIMGSGKTSLVTQHLETLLKGSHNDVRIIYVTPFLDQVDRVIKECKSHKFVQPDKSFSRTKRDSFTKLIEGGHNVATTHSLFSVLTQDIYQKLNEHNYILVLDEVIECVTKFDSLKPSDLNMLIDTRHIYTDQTNYDVIWDHAEHHSYDGKFNSVMNLCDNRKLTMYGDKVILEKFPADFLSCFREVYILTYLFEGSAMSAYLKAHGHAYEMLTIHNDELKPWSEYGDESSLKGHLKDLITIYDGSMNRIGEKEGHSCPLSSSWYDRQARSGTDTLKQLRGSTGNYFKKVAGTKATQNAWTVFKNHKSRLQGDGYAKGWIPFNCRATNEHIERRSLAYLCNVYHSPVIVQYFERAGIKFNQDLYALSEMIQWIWRSQIRRYDPIHLFIPSERMRRLLNLWLDSQSTPELIRKLN